MNYLIRGAQAIFSPPYTNTSAADAATNTVSDIRIANGVIAELGGALLPQPGETLINASGCVIYPGLVNSHHHLAQSIMKGVPQGLNQSLGDWLASVPYRFWPSITPQLMYDAARLGFYELLRSGATTCADHHYLYHAHSSQEVEDALWQAAADMGVRLVLCRGHASVRGSHRGMQRSKVEPESLELALQRMQHSYDHYHQADPMAMRRLVVAPTSLMHSVTAEGLRVLAEFARSHDLKMHSHLLEVAFDEEQAQQLHGCSAVDYAEQNHWLGEDVWFAHLVRADQVAIARLAASGTGIAHCPTSNCRLGSGVAPVVTMAAQGMPISIGVDGSASSESGSMIQELNLTWLLHRALHGPQATDLASVLDWGSRAGARLLGLEGVGELIPGQAADLVLYDIDQPRFAGVHSPLWAPLMCAEPVTVKYSFVQGKAVVQDGKVLGLDEANLVHRVRSGVADLVAGLT